MSPIPPRLDTLEEIERGCFSGLTAVLPTEGVEDARCALWSTTGWHDYICASRASEEQKRVGWEMLVRMEEKLVGAAL